ncbi:hypothetical protein TKK_0019312 [Trichogramma kaykai]|uniref:DUF4201 domain-containing protein n=1 Tax=Trichogramma kaykai TaxID=54128 RepID=A0ABD2VTI9_9HYME
MLTNATNFKTCLLGTLKNDIPFETWTDDQLTIALEDAVLMKKTLTLENEVFERYLRRKYPDTMTKYAQITESTRQGLRARAAKKMRDSDATMSSLSIARAASLMTTAGGVPQPVSAKQVVATGGKGLRLTLNHRIELINQELDIMRQVREEMEKNSAKKEREWIDRLKETEFRIWEVEQNSAQFEADVIEQANPISKQIPSNKFLKFLRFQDRMSDHLLDTLHLKFTKLKQIITNVRREMKQSRELGSNLRPIDFEKLEIEIGYVLNDNEENNRTFKALKLLNGEYQLKMKKQTDLLQDCRAQLARNESDLAKNQLYNATIKRDKQRAKREADRASELHARVQELLRSYVAPSVVEFAFTENAVQEARRHYRRTQHERQVQLFKIQARKRELLRAFLAGPKPLEARALRCNVPRRPSVASFSSCIAVKAIANK